MDRTCATCDAERGCATAPLADCPGWAPCSSPVPADRIREALAGDDPGDEVPPGTWERIEAGLDVMCGRAREVEPEVAALRAEVERLRAALTVIVNVGNRSAVEIAKDALAGGPR